MWLLRLTMRLPRPLARAWNRLNVGASSTSMRATLRVSMSALWLFSAFAIADSSTLRTSTAPFLGVKRSVASALPTGWPRTMSATSRHFCGEMRAYFSLAATCMGLLRGRLLVARVPLERAGRCKLAELVADHVLGDEHRDVLLAVVNRNREPD